MTENLSRNAKTFRMGVDGAMTLALLLLMAYEMAGRAAHGVDRRGNGIFADHPSCAEPKLEPGSVPGELEPVSDSADRSGGSRFPVHDGIHGQQHRSV